MQHAGPQAGKGLFSHNKELCGRAAVGKEMQGKAKPPNAGARAAKYGRRCLT
ncbi:hypothetical protein GCM10027272_10730 [Hymenobacter frigidus]